jgi:putative radical SAM enzyme (TIGR03279 family)
MLKISKVIKNQIGSEIGLKKGDEILAFNGFLAEDILDYFYYDGQEFFTLTANTRDGEVDFEIEKDFDESLGLEFLSDGLEIKNCRNSCIFCFVDQMPKGMRPSLYVKDDDYRQSFLRGNFVTLTNVTDREIDRIIRLQLSPIYVSVQVTDSEIRKKMLGNRFAGDILEKLKKLTENGILVHT